MVYEDNILYTLKSMNDIHRHGLQISKRVDYIYIWKTLTSYIKDSGLCISNQWTRCINDNGLHITKTLDSVCGRHWISYIKDIGLRMSNQWTMYIKDIGLHISKTLQ